MGATPRKVASASESWIELRAPMRLLRAARSSRRIRPPFFTKQRKLTASIISAQARAPSAKRVAWVSARSSLVDNQAACGAQIERVSDAPPPTHPSYNTLIFNLFCCSATSNWGWQLGSVPLPITKRHPHGVTIGGSTFPFPLRRFESNHRPTWRSAMR